MATSGTQAFDLAIDDIIEEAYERNGRHLETEHSGQSLITARRSLNLLFQEWANDQINLFKVELENFTCTQADADVTLASDVSDVLDVYLRRDGTDTDMVRVGRDQFSLFPDKDSQARPTNFFIERFPGSVVMNLWPAPENSTDVIYYYAIKRIDDVGYFDNTADVPQRWLDAVCAGLAYRLAFKTPEIDVNRLAALKADYAEVYGRAKDEDRERVPTRITPARSRYR